MKIFYICQCGKHISRFFSHVFIRSEGNFFEYALHHGLSVFLIVFSFLSNQWLIGIFVLLIHDYSDFALITARAYKDCRYTVKGLLDAIYVHAFIAWIGCRIVLFSYVAIYSGILLFLNSPAKLTEF
jgi:ceramide synthetase